MNFQFTTTIRKFIVMLLLLTSLAACDAPASSPAAPAEEAAVSAPEQEAEAAPAEVEEAAAAEATAAPAAEANQDAPAVEPVANTKLNLNTVAGDELLSTIPGFGNRMVREFQEYRPYISIQQFRREIGKYVDEAQVADYEQYVYVPINVDESDAATITQIPGVDDVLAEALVGARPFGSNAAFLEKLGESLAADEVAIAASYLEAE